MQRILEGGIRHPQEVLEALMKKSQKQTLTPHIPENKLSRKIK
jgi:hypothetical protein